MRRPHPRKIIIHRLADATFITQQNARQQSCLRLGEHLADAFPGLLTYLPQQSAQSIAVTTAQVLHMGAGHHAEHALPRQVIGIREGVHVARFAQCAGHLQMIAISNCGFAAGAHPDSAADRFAPSRAQVFPYAQLELVRDAADRWFGRNDADQRDPAPIRQLGHSITLRPAGNAQGTQRQEEQHQAQLSQAWLLLPPGQPNRNTAANGQQQPECGCIPNSQRLRQPNPQ